MFTGIITEIGKVKKIGRNGSGISLCVTCKNLLEEIKIGDSVAVNGVCLSVTKKGKELTFDVVKNTVKNTNLKRLKINDLVNLEGAMKVGERISGHIVTGHVDGERRIKDIKKKTGESELDIEILPKDKCFLFEKGSIAIDGVSLTIGRLYGSLLRVFLIPHTMENSILGGKRAGGYVNVEFDTLAKQNRAGKKDNGVTKNVLERNGFI